jgi:hypothetical protein
MMRFLKVIGLATAVASATLLSLSPASGVRGRVSTVDGSTYRYGETDNAEPWEFPGLLPNEKLASMDQGAYGHQAAVVTLGGQTTLVLVARAYMNSLAVRGRVSRVVLPDRPVQVIVPTGGGGEGRSLDPRALTLSASGVVRLYVADADSGAIRSETAPLPPISSLGRVGYNEVVAVARDGSAFAWSTYLSQSFRSPVRWKPSLGPITAVSDSNDLYESYFAVTQDGKVHGWGRGNELGNASLTSAEFADGAIADLPASITAVEQTFEVRVALDSFGRVWVWSNDRNQYQPDGANVPVRVIGIAGAERIAALGGSFFVIDFLGQVWIKNALWREGNGQPMAVRVLGPDSKPLTGISALSNVFNYSADGRSLSQSLVFIGGPKPNVQVMGTNVIPLVNELHQKAVADQPEIGGQFAFKFGTSQAGFDPEQLRTNGHLSETGLNCLSSNGLPEKFGKDSLGNDERISADINAPIREKQANMQECSSNDRNSIFAYERFVNVSRKGVVAASKTNTPVIIRRRSDLAEPDKGFSHVSACLQSAPQVATFGNPVPAEKQVYWGECFNPQKSRLWDFGGVVEAGRDGIVGDMVNNPQEVRFAGRIVRKGNGVCTGALGVDTRYGQKRVVLFTAHHCLAGEGEFLFVPGAGTNGTISGLTAPFGVFAFDLCRQEKVNNEDQLVVLPYGESLDQATGTPFRGSFNPAADFDRLFIGSRNERGLSQRTIQSFRKESPIIESKFPDLDNETQVVGLGYPTTMHNGTTMVVAQTKVGKRDGWYRMRMIMGGGASGGPLMASGKLLGTSKERTNEVLSEMAYVPITDRTLKAIDALVTKVEKPCAP